MCSDKKVDFNFFNCCPLRKKELPTEECSLGKPEMDPKFKNRVLKEPQECLWWLNSKDHNYCFWNYLALESKPDGSMSELNQSKLAILLGCSISKVHVMLQEGMIIL